MGEIINLAEWLERHVSRQREPAMPAIDRAVILELLDVTTPEQVAAIPGCPYPLEQVRRLEPGSA